MPGRGAAEVWPVLESEVEIPVQGQKPLAGFSSDIVKAFNNLPRFPFTYVARRLGLPETLLLLWSSFLGSVHRFFLLRDTVGPPIDSTSGYPEGCPLSPLAVVLTNHLYHTYVRVFNPDVRSLGCLVMRVCSYGVLLRHALA